jgi:N-carbamoyl-L-amino-acid hydrolase
MNQRQDALLAALRVVARLNALCLDAGPEVFFTVGRFEVHPNAPSVVPGRATFSMDLRHRDGAVLEALDARFDAVIGEVVPPCVAKITRLVRAAPNGFDHGIRRLAHGVAAALGLAAMDVLSAAGHDARHMAPLAPSAMVFVPSKDGLSHHEAEWTEPEHLTAGTRVLAALLLDLAGVGRQNDHGK